jgi:hypothetical protein
MSRATKSFGGVRHCSLRALLSNSFLNDHKLNKMQSALLPKKQGIGDCDGTSKAARKGRKLCICKSRPLLQAFSHQTLPPVLRGGKTTRYGQAAMERLKVETNPNLD